jgi:hypothetical protein
LGSGAFASGWILKIRAADERSFSSVLQARLGVKLFTEFYGG